MKLARYLVLASAIAALSAPPADVAAQTFTLDPTSRSLPTIPATAGDVPQLRRVSRFPPGCRPLSPSRPRPSACFRATSSMPSATPTTGLQDPR